MLYETPEHFLQRPCDTERFLQRPRDERGGLQQGTVKGAKRRGSQKNNIKEWTGMKFGDSLRAAKDMARRKGIVATSSLVPRRPSRLRD